MVEEATQQQQYQPKTLTTTINNKIMSSDNAIRMLLNTNRNHMLRIISLFLIFFIILCSVLLIKLYYSEYEINISLDSYNHSRNMLKQDDDTNICSSNNMNLLQKV